MSLIQSLRSAAARRLVAAARSRERRSPHLADRLLRIALFVEPTMAEAAPALVTLRHARGDRLAALEAARTATRRFPAASDAWFLLGEAYQSAFKMREALGAFEHALALRERPDAALRAGYLYRRDGLHVEAAASYARAYAAGGAPEALYENAVSLWAAGDTAQAEQALELWGTHFVDGPQRVRDAKNQLAGKL